MSRSLKPFCCHRNRYLNITTCSFLLLLVSNSLQLLCHAQARSISNFQGTNKDNVEGEGEEEKGVKMEMRSLIGSRPPRCERRCKSCGHCVAVQVPIVPQIKGTPRIKRSRSMHLNAYARGDDISNYKPMTWKCKCGDTFFNP